MKIQVSKTIIESLYNSGISMPKLPQYAKDEYGLVVTKKQLEKAFKSLYGENALRTRKRTQDVDIEIVDELELLDDNNSTNASQVDNDVVETEDDIEDADAYKNEAQEVVASYQ